MDSYHKFITIVYFLNKSVSTDWLKLMTTITHEVKCQMLQEAVRIFLTIL